MRESRRLAASSAVVARKRWRCANHSMPSCASSSAVWRTRAACQRAAILAVAAVRSSCRSSVEAGSRDRLLVHARWNEEVEAQSSADVEFGLGDGAGDHHGIGEEEPPARAQEPGPFLQRAGPVRQVVDGVDAQHGVEGAIGKQQAGTTIRDLKGGPFPQALGGCLRLSDAGGLDVEAGDAAASAPHEVQGRAAGAAADVEQVHIRAEAEELCDLGLLGTVAPAGLAQVLAIDLASQRCREIGAEAAVMGTVEVEPVRGLGIMRMHRSSLAP